MNRKRNVLLCLIMTVITGGFIYLVKTFDVGAIGPNNSKVGFSGINGWFKDLVGYNDLFYKIAEVLGIVVFGIVAMYACIGLYQLIKRKSLFKIDKKIILLGFFYVVVLVLYVLFDKIAINYRPVLKDGVLEPSFPSSHTMLAICVCASSLIISKHFINRKYVKAVNIVTAVLMVSVFLSRLFSGVHWFSDIIGGVIISLTLIMYFKAFYDYIRNSKIM